MITHILFVCHGNICRSPMAEFVMKQLVREAGCADRFEIDSCAVSREEIGNDCVRRPQKSPRPAKLSSSSAEIEQWDRPD